MRKLILIGLFIFLWAGTAPAHLIVDVGVSAIAPAIATKSSALTYTINVTDYAYDLGYGVVVTDQLPAGAKFVSASGGGWNCSQSSGAVTCGAESIAPGVS